MIHNLSMIVIESQKIDSYMEEEDYKSLLQYLKSDLFVEDGTDDFKELTSYVSRLLSRIS